jgi:hypothetical protein
MARNRMGKREVIVKRVFDRLSPECGAERRKFRLPDFCNLQGDVRTVVSLLTPDF